MDMSFTIESLVSGLISGVIASILCSLLYRSLKPKIVISDCIAKSDENGKPAYRLKIVNLSRNYIKNIHITAQFIDKQNTPDRSVVVYARPLKFVRTDFHFIDPYKRSDEEARYAIRLKFQEDLETIWKDPAHSSIEIAVYCENEMTGVGKVFKKVYSAKDHIIKGTYETGKSTQIIRG